MIGQKLYKNGNPERLKPITDDEIEEQRHTLKLKKKQEVESTLKNNSDLPHESEATSPVRQEDDLSGLISAFGLSPEAGKRPKHSTHKHSHHNHHHNHHESKNSLKRGSDTRMSFRRSDSRLKNVSSSMSHYGGFTLRDRQPKFSNFDPSSTVHSRQAKSLPSFSVENSNNPQNGIIPSHASNNQQREHQKGR